VTLRNLTPTVVPGGEVTYVVTMTNTGTISLSEGGFTVTLPSGLTYARTTGVQEADATRTSTTDPTVGATRPAWASWATEPGGTAVVTFVATIPVTMPLGTYHVSVDAAASDGSAQVPASYDGADPVNTDDDMTVVQGTADLKLKVRASNPVPLVGSEMTFTVALTNYGPLVATNVTVSATLPSGYQYLGYNTNQGNVGTAAQTGAASTPSYDPATGLWTVGTLQVNETVELALGVQVRESGEYNFFVQVASSDQEDPNSTPGTGGGTEDDEDSTVVAPAASAYYVPLVRLPYFYYLPAFQKDALAGGTWKPLAVEE